METYFSVGDSLFVRRIAHNMDRNTVRIRRAKPWKMCAVFFLAGIVIGMVL